MRKNEKARKRRSESETATSLSAPHFRSLFVSFFVEEGAGTGAAEVVEVRMCAAAQRKVEKFWGEKKKCLKKKSQKGNVFYLFCEVFFFLSDPESAVFSPCVIDVDVLMLLLGREPEGGRAVLQKWQRWGFSKLFFSCFSSSPFPQATTSSASSNIDSDGSGCMPLDPALDTAFSPSSSSPFCRDSQSWTRRSSARRRTRRARRRASSEEATPLPPFAVVIGGAAAASRDGGGASG